MNQDITQELRFWLDETISTIPDPVHLYPVVAADAHSSSQQRSWFRPLPTLRFQSMFSATKFVVAGVIVALFGGFLLTGVLTQQDDVKPLVGSSSSPEMTTTLPIELPAEIPAGIDSGTLDTPLGQARWVHLRGDETTLPPGYEPLVSTSDGYVALEWDSTPPTLWRSSDLLTWAPEPLGVEADYGELAEAGGTYWLNTHEPTALWRSQDAKAWEQVDLDRLAPPAVADGSNWRSFADLPLEHDGVVIVPLLHNLGNFDDGVRGLGILVGAGLADVELPDGMSHAVDPAFAVDDAGFVSYNIGSDGLVHVHRSDDGRDWIETDVIGDDAGEPTDITSVYTSGGSVILDTTGEHWWTPRDIWTTTDGVVWERVQPPTNGFEGESFASGWISGTQGDDWDITEGLWFQPKQGAPLQIDISEMDFFTPGGGRSSEGARSSNTWISSFMLDGGAGRREAWIITFDDVPA